MMELILFKAFGHPTLSSAEPEGTKAGGKRAKSLAGENRERPRGGDMSDNNSRSSL
jgi:hypothetical protein